MSPMGCLEVGPAPNNAENWDLSEDERSQLDQARSDLTKLLQEEELKFYQRAKVTDVLLGDNNTSDFQMVANGKHRKTRIFSLDHEDGKIGGLTLRTISHVSTRTCLDHHKIIP
jgi:hypothetical protein